MRTIMTKTAIALSAIALAATSLPLQASAQTGGGVGSIVNCDASGQRQGTGAILGALAGAAIGNNVSHGKNAPIVGAVAGAAAGSYIGCQQQRNKAARHAASYGSGNFVANTNVNIRSGPSTRASKVGSLGAGQRFEAMGRTGNWIAVGNGGQTTGYVSASYVSAVG
ncbi:SH3 domain-containing protein [soil metagenome]